MSKQTIVCICGGGNGAHVMAGLAAASARAPEVRVLTLYDNEAEVWTEKLAEGELTVAKHLPDGSVKEIKAKLAVVTKDASKAVPGADVIIICVPAFAHQQYFTAIAPYVGANTAIIGLPGRPGFEFQCFHLLGDRAKDCVILNYESLPWACRISEFGKKVDILGTKETLMGSKGTGSRVAADGSQAGEDPAQVLQSLLGPQPVLSLAHSYVEITLMTKAIVHPVLMYVQWKDWDGTPLSEKPLFYQGLSEDGASLLATVSDEIVKTARAISSKRTEMKMDNVETFESWFFRNYHKTIQNPASLYTAMRTNTAYTGLTHPMKETSPGQFVPDFKYRYLSEDVPFGLTVVKGIAQIAEVATPSTDEVLTWTQGHLGKEYMVGSELKGKDVKDTRAPQAFGFNSFEDLKAIM